MAITQRMLADICDEFFTDLGDGSDEANVAAMKGLAKKLKVHVVWEPTNAEKLQLSVDEWEASGDTRSLAEYLDANGVKAGN